MSPLLLRLMKERERMEMAGVTSIFVMILSCHFGCCVKAPPPGGDRLSPSSNLICLNISSPSGGYGWSEVLSVGSSGGFLIPSSLSMSCSLHSRLGHVVLALGDFFLR